MGLDPDGYPLTTDMLVQRSGVSRRTLAVFEENALLVPVQTKHGARYRSKDEVRLQLILKAQRLGFSLNEIRQVIEHLAKVTPTDDHTRD